MPRPSTHLPLSGLRAFEAAARHLSFTKAGLELRVTQAAVSHQVRTLEEMIGKRLFRRLPRGLALTDEGRALVPVTVDAFKRLRAGLEQVERGQSAGVVTIGAVGTFVTGWLLPRLAGFHAAYPHIDVRLMTNNNRVDLAGEGLDYAIRFGDGAWHGTDAVRLMWSPMTPLCAPALARRLVAPGDLAGETLLLSYRADEWPRWFAAAGIEAPLRRGILFDSSLTMAEAAKQGAGVALLPAAMFARDLECGLLSRPFANAVTLGGYWLTSLRSRPSTAAMQAFRGWLETEARAGEVASVCLDEASHRQ